MGETRNNETGDYLSHYLTSNVNTLCRICLEKANKLVPIFDQIKPAHFSTIIMACASVQIVRNDNLPPNICTKCISKLNIAFQFKTECEMANTKFRHALENMQLHTWNNKCMKAAGKLDEDILIYQDILDNTAVKGDVVEASKEGQMEDTFSCNKHIVIATNVPLHEQNDDKQSVTKECRKKRTLNKEHKCYVCDKVFRTKASMVHHVRIHTGERPYVCHLCDKRFINSGHLHTHLRTHTGEKNHVCSACTKSFATAQQLTKHTIAVHTSERPYGCPYCEKRFANSSNLNTHVKIHTGEKNFYCDQCGKAFSTKAQLCQHMLIHTGEKPFLCELCQKRFSQKAHLVRHAKMHQKTD